MVEVREKAIAELSKTLEIRKKNIPEKVVKYAIHSPNVSEMETIATEQLGYNQINDKFDDLIGWLKSNLEKFKELKDNSN